MIEKFPASTLNIKVFERRSKKRAKPLVELFSASKESTYLLRMKYTELNNSVTWKNDSLNQEVKELISSVSSGLSQINFSKSFN